MNECQATARVRVLVEVVLAQPWGPGETIANVQQRAAREAIAKTQIAVQGNARIIGEPVVEVVILGPQPIKVGP